MMRHLLAAILVLCSHRASFGLGDDPFKLDVAVAQEEGRPVLTVRFDIPERHFLYAESIEVSADGAVLRPLTTATPEKVMDKFSEEEKLVFHRQAAFTYAVDGAGGTELKVSVAYQGCDDEVCFFPQTRRFTLALVAGAAETVEQAQGVAAAGGEGGMWKDLLADFDVTATGSGFMAVEQFLSFLGNQAEAGGDAGSLSEFRRRGLLLTVVLLLLGGMALNLTPCVLPLIPINLAIIGAGNRARSKREGFALGGLYGLGMALAYGALGLVVVLTGSKFGALNASVLFNAGIAAVFVVLALAMFDIIQIDLSRFQGRVGSGPGGGKGRYLLAFSMGLVAALLAGACVAPVVISTLLLAGSLYSEGLHVALLLPFLLGLGMGLPWPLAGAGFAVLPKPGAWMQWVKYVFGVIILALALYYGKAAYELWRVKQAGDPAIASTAALEEALSRARTEGKPVFIDFWATWCKNCLAMEASTFKDPQVKKRLEDFIVVKYQAEFPSGKPAQDVLDAFGAIGLPTYVILTPK